MTDDVAIIREALNLRSVIAGRPEGDAAMTSALGALDRLVARLEAAEAEKVTPREGMATVYDSDGKYLGCLGIEFWRWLLVRDADQIMRVYAERDAARADAELAESRLRTADAVARVWIVGLMKDELLRAWAHPLSCVRGALAGEKEAVELGCDPDELWMALTTADVEIGRAHV